MARFELTSSTCMSVIYKELPYSLPKAGVTEMRHYTNGGSAAAMVVETIYEILETPALTVMLRREI